MVQEGETGLKHRSCWKSMYGRSEMFPFMRGLTVSRRSGGNVQWLWVTASEEKVMCNKVLYKEGGPERVRVVTKTTKGWCFLMITKSENYILAEGRLLLFLQNKLHLLGRAMTNSEFLTLGWHLSFLFLTSAEISVACVPPKPWHGAQSVPLTFYTTLF